MLDLSVLGPGSGPKDPFFDIHLHQMILMPEHQQVAHLLSMVASQRQDYDCDLRLVLNEVVCDVEKTLATGEIQWTDKVAQRVRQTAVQVCKEIVVGPRRVKLGAKDARPTGQRLMGL